MLAPERLRTEVHGALERATGSPVSIGKLRLVMGLPIHLDAADLRLWNGALVIDEASAHIDILSLLTGRPRLTRLVLDGAHLTIRRVGGEAGVDWSPAPFARLSKRAEMRHPEQLLAPLFAIESTVRMLLSKPLLADAVQLRRARVSYIDDASNLGGSVETLWFAGLNGTLRHSRIRGHAELFLKTYLATKEGRRGAIEWEGTRSRNGAMRISMAATELELDTLAPYLMGRRQDNQLGGRLTGIADFETTSPGAGRLSTDLIVRGLTSVVGEQGEAAARQITVSELALRAKIDMGDRFVEISNGRIEGPELGFGIDLVVGRPVRWTSNAGLSISMRDVDLEQARALVGWLPERSRLRAGEIARSVQSGRLVFLEFSGAATLRQWRDTLSGRVGALPRGLQILANVEDVGIEIEKGGDRFDALGGRITWRGDVLTVAGASGMLNGAALPTLDLDVTGVGRLFASKNAGHKGHAGAIPLAGLTPLWAYLSQSGSGGEEPTGDGVPPISIEIDHLHHPALIWPLDDIRARVESSPSGVRLHVSEGRWAGVPVTGSANWQFRPERRVAVSLQVADAEPGDDLSDLDPSRATSDRTEIPGARNDDPIWASGRFEVGPMHTDSWNHHAARGRFRAARADFHFEDMAAELAPRGTLRSSMTLDLGHDDHVPYDVTLTLTDGDVATLLTQKGFSRETATGTLSVDGTLRGSVRPDRSVFASATGSLTLEAVDGTLQRSVPPILAVALASESFTGFSSRERLRYRRFGSTLRFEQGILSTEELELDGPDVRLFASGSLDLSHPPYEIDAEVVLFLFRQIDRALEKIPLLNVLLLGANKNLIAAYFQLSGPWGEPVAEGKPLRTLSDGSKDVLIDGIPRLVLRGMDVLGDLINPPKPEIEQAAES